MNTFSIREQRIIKIIGHKKMTLNEISAKLFETGHKPFDTNIAVANSVRRIIKKCEYHGLAWTLTKVRENCKLIIRKIKII